MRKVIGHNNLINNMQPNFSKLKPVASQQGQQPDFTKLKLGSVSAPKPQGGLSSFFSGVGNVAKGAVNTLADVGKGIGGAVVNTGLGLSSLFFKGAQGIGKVIGDPQGEQFAKQAGDQTQALQKSVSGIPGMKSIPGKIGQGVGTLATLLSPSEGVAAAKTVATGVGDAMKLPVLAEKGGVIGKTIAYGTQKVLSALPEATVGFGYGKTQGQSNKEALGTGATFGALSTLGEVVGDTWRAFKGGVAENTAKALGMTGKMNATQAVNKIPQSIRALKIISNLAPDIKVLDESGVEKTFDPTKATFYETAQAWTKSRDAIYSAYTDLAKKAGDEGASFTPNDLSKSIKILEDSKANATAAFRSKADSLINDMKVNFGVDTKGGKMLMKNIPLEDMQKFVEKLNTDL